jgi:dolichyl-phosphate beta-glucosyltransferase
MKLSIVVPCYNESKDIAKNSEIIKNYLESIKQDYELILVNDGSKDNTKEVIEAIPGVKALSYEPNRGKGGAVKYGIESATGDYVLFMDADLSTDLEAIDRFIKIAPNYDMVIGSRHAKDSVIKKKQPAVRVFIGWCCRKLVNMKFHFKYKDTQCGFKAMRTDIAKKIVSKQVVNNFAFDVEYLYIAKLNNLSIYEMGVIWADDRGSTVSPLKSSIKFFKDLSFIKKHKKTYLFNEEK